MSGEYQNKIGLINMSVSGPKKYVYITTEIKLVCFRCGIWFFGSVGFGLFSFCMCGDVLVGFFCCWWFFVFVFF